MQGHPELIPKEALGWAARRALEAMQVKEALAWVPAQMCALPSACMGWRSQQVGKRIAMFAPSLVCHSTMMPCFYGSRAFSANFPGCGAPYSCPFRLSFHSQQLFPLWIHTPDHPLQHPVPLRSKRHMTQAAVRQAAARTMRTILTLSCLSQTVHCILLWSPEGPFLSQLISPTWGGFSECRGLSLPSASHQGCWSLFWFLFSFFLSFILPGWERIFLVFLGVQSLLLMISRCSVRTIPFVDVLLTYCEERRILSPPIPPSWLLPQEKEFKPRLSGTKVQAVSYSQHCLYRSWVKFSQIGFFLTVFNVWRKKKLTFMIPFFFFFLAALGLWLWHMGSSFWCVWSFVEARGLFVVACGLLSNGGMWA